MIWGKIIFGQLRYKKWPISDEKVYLKTILVPIANGPLSLRAFLKAI